MLGVFLSVDKFEENAAIFGKIKNIYDLEIPHLDIPWQKLLHTKKCTHKEIYKDITATLLIRVEIWEHPQNPSTDDS